MILIIINTVKYYFFKNKRNDNLVYESFYITQYVTRTNEHYYIFIFFELYIK